MEISETGIIRQLHKLKKIITRTLIFYIAIVAILFPFTDDIYSTISSPIVKSLKINTTLIATEVTSTFFVPLKLILLLSFSLSLPYALWQAWNYLKPNISQGSHAFAAPLIISSVSLFYLGMCFSFFVVFPIVFGFFSGISPEGVTYTPDIGHSLNMVVKLFFAFGISFQIPIVTFLMVATKKISIEDLTQMRPYVIIGCFVFGMLLTPPDIISQSLLAIPMFFLFELGIIATKLLSHRAITHKSELG